MRIIRTRTPEQTHAVGRRLAEALRRASKPRKHAALFALSGTLGSGKTTFAQGFARGMGIERRLTSPTFILMRRYRVKTPKVTRPIPTKRRPNRTTPFRWLYHLDCYRLKEKEELEAFDFSRLLKEPSNCILLEWPKVARALLPRSTRWIAFVHRGEKEREIRVRNS